MPSQRGFTLIETLVSLVIFLLIAVGVAVGLQHTVNGNIFDSQRQSVLNTTLAILDQSPPGSLCPAPNGTTVQNATTPTQVAVTIDITCAPVAIAIAPPSPNPPATVYVTQVMATAHWTTLGVARSVTVQK